MFLHISARWALPYLQLNSPVIPKKLDFRNQCLGIKGVTIPNSLGQSQLHISMTLSADEFA